jgi:predicted transcriptional regulator
MAQYYLEGIKLESFLGPLEARLLETLWASNKRPATVREIHQLMAKDSKIAYTTVMTTMNRLHEKGLLNRKIKRGKGGLYYVYWPKMEKEAFERYAIRTVLESLIGNFGEKVTSCFVERMSADKSNLEILKRELEKMEEKND